jgi:hypothetical protein
MGWLPSLGLPGRADSIVDAQHLLHDGGEDVEGDLVKDLLQSPGPKVCAAVAAIASHV